MADNFGDFTHDDIVWLTLPRLIGIMLNYFLLGVLTVQVYVYYLNYKDDKMIIKLMTYAIFALDIIQTCSATYDASQWFAHGWGNVPKLIKLHTGFLNVPLLSSVIATMVQVFFGWRIGAFSELKFIYPVISILAFAQLGGAIGVAYYIIKYSDEVVHHIGILYTVGVRLGVSAVVDILIASFMTYFLLRNGTTYLRSSTNAIVTKLVQLTIETGTITATAAILDLVFFVALPNNSLHQISGVCLSKLYSNSLLVFLNNRTVKSPRGIMTMGTFSLPAETIGGSNRVPKLSLPDVSFVAATALRSRDSLPSMEERGRMRSASATV